MENNNLIKILKQIPNQKVIFRESQTKALSVLYLKSAATTAF